MRALVTDGSAAHLATRHPEPKAVPGEVVVRPTLVAVGGLEAALGRGLLDFRGVPGFQFAGVVESVGEGVPGDLVGTRVTGSPIAACGDCDLCRRGLALHCRAGTILGVRGRDGCLAERCALPVTNLVPLPDDLEDDRAVFAPLLGAALEAARQLTVEGKPYVTVLGDGPLGLLTAQVMSRRNASVRLVGRHAESLALCEKWGVRHRPVNDIGHRADQDVVVDCTGAPDGLALALALVRPRGTILRKTLLPPGAPGDGLVDDLVAVVTDEITLVGSFLGPVPEAVRMLARGDVEVIGLRGRRHRLDDGEAILRAAEQSGAKSVLVEI